MCCLVASQGCERATQCNRNVVCVAALLRSTTGTPPTLLLGVPFNIVCRPACCACRVPCHRQPVQPQGRLHRHLVSSAARSVSPGVEQAWFVWRHTTSRPASVHASCTRRSALAPNPAPCGHLLALPLSPARYPNNPVLRLLTPSDTCRPLEIYPVHLGQDAISVNVSGECWWAGTTRPLVTAVRSGWHCADKPPGQFAGQCQLRVHA